MTRLYFLAVLIGLTGPAYSLSRPSTMVLENNGYKNMVVAIHESIPEDKSLLDKLKEEMTKASKILYTATKQRAYFKEIKILVPATWSNDASYKTPSAESLALADVIITDPIRKKRSLPQSRSYEGCGKQGVHVLLSKEFLTVPRTDPYLGNPAKYFIHAFAQFRWGVFQEYAEEGENVFYMSPSSGQPEAVRCTFMIRGIVQKNNAAHTICYSKLLAERQHVLASVDDKTGLYDADCVWRPYPRSQRTKASLMDHQFIAELVTFCGDDPADYATYHNFEAPSKHNRLCAHRSTWSVITETDDFKGGKNPATTLTDDQIKPTFVVMKATARKRRSVVVVDPTTLDTVDQSEVVENALKHIKHECSLHGRDVSVLGDISDTNLKETTYQDTVELYPDSYNTVDEERFSSHVSKVVKNLKNDNDDAHLVIVTNNYTSNLHDVLGQEADSSLHVSVITKGDIKYLINDNKDKHAVHTTGERLGHTLLDKLRHVTLVENGKTTVVKQDEIVLTGTSPVSGVIEIDSTLEGKLSFIFQYEKGIPYVQLISPTNMVYDTKGNNCSVDNISKVIVFHFGSSEVGSWKYSVHQSSEDSQQVHVTVISEVDEQDPLIVRPSVKFVDGSNNSLLLHVDVRQGLLSLLGVNVTAKIEIPGGNMTYLQLLDNGAGADVLKNDGIYSRIFITPSIRGHYHVAFIVMGEAGLVFSREEEFTTDKENLLKKSVTKHQKEDNFQRQISGGTLYVDDYGTVDVSIDVTPPSRVTDLEASTNIHYRNTIMLKWTAPGDDHDHGKVAGYEVFIGYGITDMRLLLTYISTGIYEGQGHVEMETISAHAYGAEQETFLWKVKEHWNIYVFAVRGFDTHGNRGDVSNIATAAGNINVLM